jgi:hypothetical protein
MKDRSLSFFILSHKSSYGRLARAGTSREQ